MIWEAGSEQDWPRTPFRVLQGELLVVASSSQSFGVLRLDSSYAYPGLDTAATNSRICLRLRAIQKSQLEIVPTATSMKDWSGWTSRSAIPAGVAASTSPSTSQPIEKLTAFYSLLSSTNKSWWTTTNRSVQPVTAALPKNGGGQGVYL